LNSEGKKFKQLKLAENSDITPSSLARNKKSSDRSYIGAEPLLQIEQTLEILQKLVNKKRAVSFLLIKTKIFPFQFKRAQFSTIDADRLSRLIFDQSEMESKLSGSELEEFKKERKESKKVV
jgi:pyruvate formate-lyase activating enzyme-like uncharacterized protein